MNIFFYIFFLLSPFLTIQGGTLLEEANLNYQKGEQASSYQERKNAFNQALRLYTELEEKEGNRSSELYQALANSYFQLEAYPWSILYNYRALTLDPYNETIRSHLNLAKQKLGFNNEIIPASFLEKVKIKSFFSSPLYLKVIFWAILITFISCSLAIWWDVFLLKFVSILCLSITFLLLINLFVLFYFSPIEAVLVTSSGLYRAADLQQSQLTPQPLLAGTKIQVLESPEKGSWLKILSSDGQIGYIPAFTARLI